MFTNLSQNSILYILETKDEPKLVSGSVVSVSMPRPQFATFGQTMDSVVDIVATDDGDRREFKQVPCNNSIANFGADAFILADSKESMTAHVNAALQTSKNIVNGYEKHKGLIPKYEAVLEELNPVLKADKEKDRAIQDLREQASELKQLLIDMTAKGDTQNK
jgi:hypothetical protein